MSELDQVLAAVDKFERDLGFTAPELIGMRIGQLREMVRDVFEDDDEPYELDSADIGSGERDVVEFAVIAAPELAAAMGEARLVREAVSELLGMFRAVSGGWGARTSSSRLRKIAERAAVPWDEYKREAPDTDEAAETRKANEELTTLRQRIDAIAEGLEHRAEINRPSKVSEICDNIAASLRRVLEGKRTHRPGVCQCTPCKIAATIETAGTEHLAAQITEGRQA